MFFRRKKDKLNPLRKIDRFIMGAIIGGAIGSVLGLTLGKKKKDENQSKEQKSQTEDDEIFLGDEKP